jgi:hypothetical protein
VENPNDGHALRHAAINQGVLRLKEGGQVAACEIGTLAKRLLRINQNETCFHEFLLELKSAMVHVNLGQSQFMKDKYRSNQDNFLHMKLARYGGAATHITA